MTSVIKKLADAKLITPPKFLADNVCYETITGSVAYGVSTDTSDVDVYGYCIPPKDIIFPHLAGHIEGFGRTRNKFDQFQQHHIHCPSEVGKEKDYDVAIYNIVKYFQLCMDCNPNMVDSLFSPRDCILTSTSIHEMVRANRSIFLHKGAWHKYKGYAYSQLHKIRNRDQLDTADGKQIVTGKRRAMIEEFGYDVKFAYHVVRLLYEVEQILEERDIDLRRHNEHLKSVRRGDITEFDLRAWAASKESDLERLYASSTIPHRPDQDAIKSLLLNCLEQHYGNLSDAIVDEGKAVRALREVASIIEAAKI